MTPSRKFSIVKSPVSVIVSSLALTVLVFFAGILINYGLDFVRIDTIQSVIQAHEISRGAYFVEQEFVDSFGGNKCDIMQSRIGNLKSEIHKVGTDLGSYSSFSFFKKKDFDYLKRKYFLLELQFFSLLQELNDECSSPYVPILFFYQIDDDKSESQGIILAEISKDYPESVAVISLDKDYKDEPLVQMLVEKYNVSSAPATIIDGQKYGSLLSINELKEIISSHLQSKDNGRT